MVSKGPGKYSVRTPVSDLDQCFGFVSQVKPKNAKGVAKREFLLDPTAQSFNELPGAWITDEECAK